LDSLKPGEDLVALQHAFDEADQASKQERSEALAAGLINHPSQMADCQQSAIFCLKLRQSGRE